MVRKTLHIPGDGEEQQFLTDGSGTDDAQVLMTIPPASSGSVMHVHTRQTERIDVISGRLLLRTSAGKRFIEAGEHYVVRRGVPHTFRNASKMKKLTVLISVYPALHFEWYLTEMARCANRHGGHWRNVSWLEMAVILHAMRDEFRLAWMPLLIQRPIIAAMALLAHITGDARRVSPFDTPVYKEDGRSAVLHT